MNKKIYLSRHQFKFKVLILIHLGLPSVLSGRDFIGIAFTGSGKSMCFIIPGIIKAIEEE